MIDTPKVPAKAYDEIINRLLYPEDRYKFEWVIGALLDGGPARVVCIWGPSSSGKTTLIKIIKRILVLPDDEQIGRRVAFQGPRLFEVGIDTFVFGESLTPVEDHPRIAVNIRTTGDHLPADKFHVLMNQINSELDTIADQCVQTFRNNPQENHR